MHAPFDEVSGGSRNSLITVREFTRPATFAGVRSRTKSIGIGDRQLLIPKEVGEIDYLGYSLSESLLVIAECKASLIGTESRFFRKEVQQFVNGRGSYAARFRRKIDWAKANWHAICSALESEPDVRKPMSSISPKSFAAIMITRRPTIAADFIKDFPCVSLTELRMAHADRGRWPYESANTSAGVCRRHV